ncbi:hypothetical protein NIES4073_64490 [Kalymmatonema gypsitolerans NIES-4073]|nr:hypothetical protein NIES4073_64490 [Scytonema sp. NIES-4073]
MQEKYQAIFVIARQLLLCAQPPSGRLQVGTDRPTYWLGYTNEVHLHRLIYSRLWPGFVCVVLNF